MHQVGSGRLGEEVGYGLYRVRRSVRTSAASAHRIDACLIIKVFSLCVYFFLLIFCVCMIPLEFGVNLIVKF